MSPRIAVLPRADGELCRAVTDAGGELTDAATADAIVWTDPHDPAGLKSALAASPARWIQLPLAGIEEFVRLGVLDPARQWTSAKGIYGYACAEHALALMLAGARRIHQHVLRRRWEAAPPGSPHRLLAGSTTLLVGTGGIGSSLAPLLSALDIRVLAVNRSGTPLHGAAATSTSDTFPQLVPKADFIVLAAALTPHTRHVIDQRILALMRPTAWVINVARGGLVDTAALVEALRNRTISGAGLDVTDPEPLPADHPLWSCENAIITPHVANTLDMSLPQLRRLVHRNVRRFARGLELEGIVDPSLGY